MCRCNNITKAAKVAGGNCNVGIALFCLNGGSLVGRVVKWGSSSTLFQFENAGYKLFFSSHKNLIFTDEKLPCFVEVTD